MDRARRTGQPVEEPSLGTETRQVLANPDGTLTARVFTHPVRARSGDTWVPVDTTLTVRPDGVVAPAAAPVDLELSAGGTAALARLRLDGGELTLRWPRPLPAPILTGSSATYPEVLPGVDLVVHATGAGFSKVLVVKSAAAARQPALSRVRFGLHTTGLTVRRDKGATTLLDAQGEQVVTFGAAWMWDSSGDQRQRAFGAVSPVAREREPARGDQRRRMGLAIDRDSLTIKPDQALLRDPATTFPVYLDPPVLAGRRHWLMVEQDLSYYGWWDSAYDARVGRDPEDSMTDRFRSYFQLDTSFVADKLIKEARFVANEKWRYSCTPEPVHLWTAEPSGPTFNWSNKPALLRLLGSAVRPLSYPHPDTGVLVPACDTLGRVEIDVTSMVADAAARHVADVTLALISDESSSTNGGKAFDNNPHIEIKYNTLPDAPVSISTAGVTGCSSTTPAYVNTPRPELRARLEDADDKQDIWATFEWREVGADTSQSIDSSAGKPGDEAMVPVTTDLVDGRTYEWRARAYNMDILGDVDAGPNTPWCRFLVDTTPPATPPAVTRSCPSGCQTLQVDQPAQFTFDAKGDPDVVAFSYAAADNASVRVPAVDGKATVTLTPTTTPRWTLLVFAEDRARNLSPSTQYTGLPVAGLPSLAGNWPVHRTETGVLADSSTYARPVTLRGGYSWQTGQGGGDAVHLDGAANTGGQTSGPVVHTNASFSVMAWLRLEDTGDWRTALSQAGVGYSGFELRYDMLSRKWAFVMRTSDADDATEHLALSNTIAQVGVSTHVAGVYDHQAGELRVYVDGRLAGRAAHRSTWDATGPFTIGYRNFYGFTPSRWLGLLDAIQVHPYAVSQRKLAEVMDARGRWGTSGWWELDGDDRDSGPEQHTLARLGGTEWTTRRQGPDALGLNGVDGFAYTSNPVVHTDESFSVGAWVRLDRSSTSAVAISQDGDLASGFSLGYVAGTGWAFSMARSGGDASVPTDTAAYPAPVQLGVWTHLIGVYDQGRRQLSLYINGRLAATDTHESTWDAQGSLILGRGRSSAGWHQFWPGGIDEVHVTGMALRELDEIKEWSGEVSYTPQAAWDFDDTVGRTRRDTTGNGHTLYVAPGGTTTTGKRGSALLFNGSADAEAYTAGPVTRTDASFTAAAWVRLDRLDTTGTAVSQDGRQDSGFTLGYDRTTRRWTFVMSHEDRADGLGSATTARATREPRTATWTHLAGTYDDKKREMKLYVDGELVGTTPHTSAWDATGPLVVGRGRLDGTPRDRWPGAVDEVRVVNRPMAPEEIRALLVTTTLGPGAWWPLDESAGFGAPDGSGNGYPLGLAGSASWTAGRCGNGLLFDGSSGRASAPGPVLRTDQSFTVAAWVRLDAIGNDAAAMSQDGRLASSFYLGYNARLNKWWFILPTADSSNPEDVVAFSATAARRGVWTHLAGVYDAATHQMRLYVDGVPSTATAVSATWDAAGATRLSGAQWNGHLIDHWPGVIDDARALARAASATDIQDIMAACPAPQAARFDNTDKVPIPDLGTAESRIVVSGVAGNAPTTLKVDVTIRHTYRGDLVIDLVGPSGAAYRLKDSAASDNARDVVVIYQVNASAEPANGTWRLRVRDVFSGDIGYIDQWSLRFG